MNPVIEKFLERPASHKVIFWLVSVAFVLYLVWTFLLSARLSEKQDLTDKIESLNTEIVNERRLAKRLDQARGEVKDLDKKLGSALQRLPDKREIPDFLASIEKKAREAGLEVTLFRPAPERLKEFYAEVPANVSVEGTFHQVATFFDEVGRLPRIVNISDISLRSPEFTEDKIRLKAECAVTTFRYLDEQERNEIRAREKGDGKTKVRRKK